MTEKTKEALKLALEAICGSGDFLFNWHECEPNNEREMQRYQETLKANEKAFKAVREALAEQPAQQQEPVAWRWVNSKGWLTYGEQSHDKFASTPLYTSPPAQRKPLTDEQIQKIWDVAAGAMPGWSRHIAYARAIEAAHGIKENT